MEAMCFRTLSWKSFENFKGPKIVVKTSCLNGATQSCNKETINITNSLTNQVYSFRRKDPTFSIEYSKSILTVYCTCKKIIFFRKKSVGKTLGAIFAATLRLPSFCGDEKF